MPLSEHLDIAFLSLSFNSSFCLTLNAIPHYISKYHARYLIFFAILTSCHKPHTGMNYVSLFDRTSYCRPIVCPPDRPAGLLLHYLLLLVFLFIHTRRSLDLLAAACHNSTSLQLVRFLHLPDERWHNISFLHRASQGAPGPIESSALSSQWEKSKYLHVVVKVRVLV